MTQDIEEAMRIKGICWTPYKQYEATIKSFYDNKSVISLTHDPVQHNCALHTEVQKT